VTEACSTDTIAVTQRASVLDQLVRALRNITRSSNSGI
jgi:hypothetical protein